MGRSPCCSKEGLNRGAWTAMEDRILTDYIKVNGEGKWRNLPKRAGLKRCGKSCRLRWLNYLRPDIKRGNITHDEEDLIIRLHKLLGNRWSLIAGRLPGRTDNEIKNYWNTNIGKKLVQPHPIPTSSNRKPSNQPKENFSHTIQRSVLHPPSPSIKSCVIPVRAKPSRFTRVFITSDPQNKHQIDHPKPPMAAAGPLVTRSTDFDGAAPHPNPPDDVSHPFDSLGDDPSDFLIDFEMDDKFLSDLLNTDFPSLCDADRGDNTRSSSPNSNRTLLFSDDLVQNSDLQSMAPLLGSGVNWL